MGVQSYTLSLRTASTNLEVEKRENSVIALEGEAAKKYDYYPSAESNIMFELIQDHDMKESVNFAKLVQGEMVRTGGRNDMGVLQANLAVLRLTYMPSVLLEVGYISTPAEEQFLMSTSGRQTMAKSIYNAIVRYKAQQTGRESKLEKPTPETKRKTDKQDKETPAGTAPAKATCATLPATDNTKAAPPPTPQESRRCTKCKYWQAAQSCDPTTGSSKA